jgi:predicted nuclease of predicted toxin-antitoxin system
MTLVQHQFLTDENIDPDIVKWLRSRGCDVIDVREQGWNSVDDRILLDRATHALRVIVTHDKDFGQLVVQEGLPCFGVIRLRPGDLPIQDYLDMLEELDRQQTPLIAPFLAVVKRLKNLISIRVRNI